MKILAGILMSLYLGLTLFGLYQYKAHNRRWGMKLVVWMSGLVLLVGVTARLVVYLESPLLLPLLIAGFSLAYLVGWLLIGSRFTGWKQHLIRGLAFALCIGPLVAMRCSELENFNDWLELLPNTSFPEMLRFFFYGLPGFFLVGAISFLISAGCEIWEKLRQEGLAITMNRRMKLGYGLLLLAMLLCVNWYIAGVFNVYECVKAGKKRILTYVCWSRPGSLSAWDLSGWTPLHNAAMGDQTEAVKWLIRAGVNVNAKDNVSNTPLGFAASRGRTETAKLLIAAGAKVNIKNKWGMTPLHTAASEAAKVLLKAGANVNTKDEDGRMPLHWAAYEGGIEVVKILLRAGAKVNVKAASGLWAGGTPLHVAALYGHTGVVKILLEAGAKVNVKAASGLWAGGTPLHWATLGGQTEAAKALIEAGAEVNAKNRYGSTPLDWGRTTKTEDLLRKHGAKTRRELDAEGKQGKKE